MAAPLSPLPPLPDLAAKPKRVKSPNPLSPPSPPPHGSSCWLADLVVGATSSTATTILLRHLDTATVLWPASRTPGFLDGDGFVLFSMGGTIAAAVLHRIDAATALCALACLPRSRTSRR
ncbi:hypothetical protein DAI22_11g075600 [Oryza sativa Japonica Group]|nr:hypothetical protein DAI22_11g075600 [Oryza sativa Japonica Group]